MEETERTEQIQTIESRELIVHTKAPGLEMVKGPEAKQIIEALGIRKCNTITRKVQLRITFQEDAYRLGQYDFTDKKGNTGNRVSAIITASIAYEPKASNLILATPYPLSLPKNALVGLGNYINATSKNFNLKGRTFTVINRNGHTYEWTEVSSF
jgi:hypothetical protein